MLGAAVAGLPLGSVRALDGERVGNFVGWGVGTSVGFGVGKLVG